MKKVCNMMDNNQFDEIIKTVKMTKNIVMNSEYKRIVNLKGEADFVTEVDYRISRFLGEKLSEITPNIGFMSEEEKGIIVPTRWILDPIDGTTNLVYGYNICSVSLALCVDEEIVFGVVYNPFNDEIFTAYKGGGAFFNGEKMTASPDRDVYNCIIEFGAGSTRKDQADLVFNIGKDLFKTCLDLRRICSSALSICYVAQGRINGYFEKELKPWDYAAAGLVLTECGGFMSKWDGTPTTYEGPNSYVCGTKQVYNHILRTIDKFDSPK